MKHYIGIDIGGTAIKAGIISEKGDVICRMTESTPPLGSSLAFVDIIWDVAKKVMAESERRDIPITGIGVSSAGQIHTDSGSVMGACGNIPNWIGTPLKTTLEEMFHLPTTVANDANCALLAECWLGAGTGSKNVVAYTIGTGVGGGILVDGKLLSGRYGIAGEIGHMILLHKGKKCTCGNNGCFEQYGSTRAFVRIAEEQSGRTGLNGRIIFEEAKTGNEIFQKVIEEFLDLHADAITGLVHLFNPEIVIIGGGVSAQGENLMKPLREKVVSRIMPAFAEGLILKTAFLGNDAGMIGAVRNFMNSQPVH